LLDRFAQIVERRRVTINMANPPNANTNTATGNGARP
jgi:hypothetical protein